MRHIYICVLVYVYILWKAGFRLADISPQGTIGGQMGFMGGLSVVLIATAVAIWFNDNVPVGEYMSDELPEASSHH